MQIDGPRDQRTWSEYAVYRLVQRGPAFAEDTEISLQRVSGKYSVKTKSHKDAREEVIDGTLKLPPDVYNGMVITAVKNLSKGAGTTVHLVALSRERPVHVATRSRCFQVLPST